MKLISLNVWGGKIFKPLIEFIDKNQKDTDIFCFQELFFGNKAENDVGGARANIAKEFENLLSCFNTYPYLAPEGSSFMWKRTLSPIGQAIFFKKDLSVIDRGGFYTRSPVTNHSGIFQYIEIESDTDKFTIGNLHGLWLPTGKYDTPDRIKQSELIRNFYNNRTGKKIISGDFNLQPDSESIMMLKKDFKNLIEDFGIISTRNSLYKDAEKYKDFISDYIFASRDINIINLKVINNLVSDHLPIMVEFS